MVVVRMVKMVGHTVVDMIAMGTRILVTQDAWQLV
jgi:hypothetical protein